MAPGGCSRGGQGGRDSRLAGGLWRPGLCHLPLAGGQEGADPRARIIGPGKFTSLKTLKKRAKMKPTFKYTTFASGCGPDILRTKGPLPGLTLVAKPMPKPCAPSPWKEEEWRRGKGSVCSRRPGGASPWTESEERKRQGNSKGKDKN